MKQVFLIIRTLIVLSCLVGLLSLAGCAGDDDDDASAGDGQKIVLETSSMPKAEYLERANETCEKAGKRFEAEYTAFAKKGVSKQSDQTSLPGILVDTILEPRFSGLIDELRVLGAPRGGEKEVEKFLNTLRQELDRTVDNPDKALDQLTPFKGAVKAARSYGLNACAESMGG